VSAVLRPPPLPRPMAVADLDAVLDIERAAYAFPWTHGNFVDSIAAGYWTRLAFDVDGALAAYAVAMQAVDEMHLLNVTVAPAHEGHGHARAMLDALEAECARRGLATLWLEVRTSNARARRLYRHRGFLEIGLRRGYYPAPDGEREDAIVMRLRLPSTPAGVGRDGVD
jgi:ribosomal-protein-alanine N-acetyltransferase